LRILIIRPGAIGDTLLTFPIIKTIRNEHGNQHITLVGNPDILPLALASGLVDETSDYGHPQWSSLFSIHDTFSPTLRDQLQQTDLAICWLRDPDGLVKQNLRMAGVQKIKIATGRPSGDKQIHVVQYLAETIGLQHVELPFKLSLKTADLSIGGSSSQPIAIHPGSGSAQKCWPASSFAALINSLWQRNYPVLLLAGPADHPRVEDIQRLLPPQPIPGSLTTLIDMPLIEVAQHLLQCRCYIGNDSGVTHLAAMLGVPTVVLFGPSDPSTWHPIGPAVTLIQESQLQSLPVETVLNSIVNSLVMA
jgi:heptosyltransferase III